MTILYISLYITVGLFLLGLMTLSGKANWSKVPGFELKLFVGVAFVIFWIIIAPIMWYNNKIKVEKIEKFPKKTLSD